MQFKHPSTNAFVEVRMFRDEEAKKEDDAYGVELGVPSQLEERLGLAEVGFVPLGLETDGLLGRGERGGRVTLLECHERQV